MHSTRQYAYSLQPEDTEVLGAGDDQVAAHDSVRGPCRADHHLVNREPVQGRDFQLGDSWNRDHNEMNIEKLQAEEPSGVSKFGWKFLFPIFQRFFQGQDNGHPPLLILGRSSSTALTMQSSRLSSRPQVGMKSAATRWNDRVTNKTGKVFFFTEVYVVNRLFSSLL